MKYKTLWIAGSVLLLVLLPALPAQTPTTGLLTVKDPSGAVVANAKLTLLSITGEERTGETSAGGSYRHYHPDYRSDRAFASAGVGWDRCFGGSDFRRITGRTCSRL